MSWLALSEISLMLGGVLHGEDRMVCGVGIDSRSLRARELFIALRGERFDGHDFVVAGGERGAAGAMVERGVDASLPQILVEDTFAGLTDFAAAWRGRCRPAMVALTGSNGKTTTRAMLVSVLGRRLKVLATHGNLNNHIGVPLTLLALREEHQAAVIELGASHPGEILRLGELVRPAVALVLNAGPAHLEGFGSVDGVARAKGELFETLPEDGVGVVNADDAYADYWCDLLKRRRTVTFGLDCAAGVDVGGRLSDRGMEIVIEGEARCLHPALPGRHNLRNALAAAAVAYSLDVGFDDIIAGLEAVRAVPGRLCALAGVGGMQLLDDSYNANPGSLEAALETLGEYGGERWLVLGDMAELGADAMRWHIKAGRCAARCGVARLFTLGALSRAAADGFDGTAECFDSCEALIARLAAALRETDAPGVTILVKGSRSARMERVVQTLSAPYEESRKC